MTPVCQSAKEAPSDSYASWLSTRTQLALAACACGSSTTFLYLVDPNRHAVYPPCLLYQTTGIYCAGCGTTRAIYALLHGRVIEALHDNALFMLALPFLLWMTGNYLLPAWRSNAWPQLSINHRILVRRGVGIVLLMLGFMALRNLPGWPFDWLKPLAG